MTTHINMEEVILKMPFNIEYVDCISYRCVPQSYWENIKKILRTHPEIVIQPYSNPSPIELFGDEMNSKKLIKKISVISDPDKVAAFKIFHGQCFCNDMDPFDDLFEQCEKFLT